MLRSKAFNKNHINQFVDMYAEILYTAKFFADPINNVDKTASSTDQNIPKLSLKKAKTK